MVVSCPRYSSTSNSPRENFKPGTEVGQGLQGALKGAWHPLASCGLRSRFPFKLGWVTKRPKRRSLGELKTKDSWSWIRSDKMHWAALHVKVLGDPWSIWIVCTILYAVLCSGSTTLGSLLSVRQQAKAACSPVVKYSNAFTFPQRPLCPQQS